MCPSFLVNIAALLIVNMRCIEGKKKKERKTKKEDSSAGCPGDCHVGYI
jgi:hypothetical protein